MSWSECCAQKVADAQVVSAAARYGIPDMPRDTSRDKKKIGLVETWMQVDLDYMITMSFSEEVYRRKGLKHPDRLMTFMQERLAAAGYYGPYVIVLHDNHGSSYWHPHLLIKDRGRSANRIEHELRPFGDLGYSDNGPVRGAGAFSYLADRATESAESEEFWDLRARWIRRPRAH